MLGGDKFVSYKISIIKSERKQASKLEGNVKIRLRRAVLRHLLPNSWMQGENSHHWSCPTVNLSDCQYLPARQTMSTGTVAVRLLWG